MLAFLPRESGWYESLNKQSKDVPILKWWADMDQLYLAATRSEILSAQNDFQIARWSATTPKRRHVEHMKDLVTMYCSLAGLDESDEDFWDQLTLSIMDTKVPADGVKYFVHTFFSSFANI